eukprot:TRINITY_DN18308_c0_g1_i4.p1 TRINITY_DN18308_c0_g1~~TRINITY_DN18308_c0_g1_i4.p1  ORF type:complete len:378 (+),score=49.75 TRINITY_DN18308_c0_g1_i4:381-1514(+)
MWPYTLRSPAARLVSSIVRRIRMLRAIRVKQYLEAMQRRGFDSGPLLAGTGLTPAKLEDPASLVDVTQCRRVIANMVQMTGDLGIGLDMGMDVNLSDYGVLAHAMLSSETLGEAINHWLHYSSLAGTLIGITIVSDDGSWKVEFDELEPLGDSYFFAVEEMLVIGIKVGGILVGQSLRTREIRLAFPPPPHVQRYEDLFDCPVLFNATRTCVTIDGPPLDTPLPGKNDELNAIVRSHCARVAAQFNGTTPTVGRVRNELLAAGPVWPSLSQAAVSLRMSGRTLRRHLASEGTTYQGVVDQFRFELAREYLLSERLATKQIGWLLGFDDDNAFRRAFKAWSGLTINQYRAQMAEIGRLQLSSESFRSIDSSSVLFGNA